MKLNEKGKLLAKKWHNIWLEEANRQEESGHFADGFVMLENEKFIKTKEDVVGWYIAGYAHGDGWCEAFTDLLNTYGAKHPEIAEKRVYSWVDITCGELLNKLKNYFEFDQEQYDKYLKQYNVEPW